MKILVATALVLLSTSFSSYANNFNCAKYSTKSELEKKARAYMKLKRLILDSDEQSFPEIGIETRWSLIKVIAPVSEKNSACLVVMQVCSLVSGSMSCDDGSMEVLGLMPASNSNKERFVPFETVNPVPNSVIAKIGTKSGEDLSYYYAKLTGKSAIAATKSLVVKIPYSGFSGIAVLGKKESYDPTPSRNWKIASPLYDLRRGLTAEVLDIQAFQLDGLDGSGADAYWNGCDQPGGKYGKCKIAPWGQSFILQLKTL